ncbi:Carbamoyl-phosphate synthase large chain [Candidatus Vidania fulgoroideae]|nr:Carbamoyl-phosphate synthase large chain [Candidatus Vidania fulgoroideae]
MKKILLIGAGPIVIGQACEFDYSGVQACRILKKENYKVFLVNNNPATVMTDKKNCHKIFYKNICLKNIIHIARKYKIKKILPNVGGQTGINIAIDFFKKKKTFGERISFLGASLKSILISENRVLFRKKMIKNNILVPFSKSVSTKKQAIKIRKKIIKLTKRKELIIRASYTLGGIGGGRIKGKKKFISFFKKSIEVSKTKKVLIEESLFGDKEIELEVLIDKEKNFIIICGIENIDELGIHTGDSVTISPIQTLRNKEIQKLRKITKSVINALNIHSCGINIQFCYNKRNGSIKVIEINPRVSRSSALASKATGYPIAKVSTLLSIGKKIGELKKIIFNKIPAFYEPSLDYIVLKTPKFSNEKFDFFEGKLGVQMKSVGESMSISLNNEDLFQKAFRSLTQESCGIHMRGLDKNEILKKSLFSNESRINSIYELYSLGEKVKSKIDRFFLNIIRKISILCNFIRKSRNLLLKNKKIFLFAKRKGFSDILLSLIVKKSGFEVTKERIKKKILCKYKTIDSCSGEFKIKSNYVFSSYFGKNEIKKKNIKKYLVLGSGPNKIGQGIEFDYCCVHALNTISSLNFFSMILNNNPETVSTDYESSNRLFFLPCDFEEIINIYKFDNFKGIFLQFCGQLSESILEKMHFFKIPVVGTKIKNIKKSENRKNFNKVIKKINGINMPNTLVIKNETDLSKKKKKIVKFPIIVRPSFVLGGENMKILKNYREFEEYVNKKKNIKYLFPFSLDTFIKKCDEYDVDFISLKKKIHILPILKHIEKLGVHSGDSNGFIKKISKKKKKKISSLIKTISKKFMILGFSNIQIGIKKKKIYLIELNTRASRTVPFISKSIGYDYVNLCVKNLLIHRKKNIFRRVRSRENSFFKKKLYAFKSPIFSFRNFPNYIPCLGPSMKSTGEVISIGNNKYRTYIKNKLHLFKNITSLENVFILKKKRNEIHNKINFFYVSNKNFIFMLNFLNEIKKINNSNTLILFKGNKKIKRFFLENIKKNILFVDKYEINKFLIKGLRHLNKYL